MGTDEQASQKNIQLISGNLTNVFTNFRPFVLGF